MQGAKVEINASLLQFCKVKFKLELETFQMHLKQKITKHKLPILEL